VQQHYVGEVGKSVTFMLHIISVYAYTIFRQTFVVY